MQQGSDLEDLYSLSIISGGQTGIDQGALGAALDLGAKCGGYCPAGRRSEAGRIPPRFPLTELAGAGYAARTLKNVDAADGTAIIFFGALSAGTALTVKFCEQKHSPFVLVDGDVVSPEQAAMEMCLGFVKKNNIRILNVAGPRASGEPRAYDYAFTLVSRLLGEHRNG